MTDTTPGKRQSAAALAYQAGDAAPRVVAKGQGMVAEQIIERARAAGVFVHESAELVALLMQVDLDSRIPPALYRAIAELLAWLYHIEAAQQAGTPLPGPPVAAMQLTSTNDGGSQCNR
ncbi:EscU/YscU/HrcU family type III secretion system export apparatus switch protein [Massilia norwichensis]|uniref:EscU/YscU/HrcU family type III secretion system export apparatus switch protein n=1 Tax=Massilia norwichensis TaxID=1442366 RepID=A0ABT2A5M0_9BURK|nr:EscU/YscU/HrcU family type III secretion system export apparatus switch protein [Massilia norwichensis]MCS0589474.1 EscU/YscU/HrcU family type III secretion system export apparatus switch protein [Massilia norwichensis]